jgi:SAM-dependent methyltransferase
MVFDKGYSQIYDLLYREKNYREECDFLENIFSILGRAPHDILDLGCGTGGHALELQKRGFEVTGVDRSESMLALARAKAVEQNVRPRFVLGDLTSFSDGGDFDAVISMFAVMGYQETDHDLKRAVEVAFDHLRPGGVFIFDGWYGPAVLKQKPETRVKEIREEDGGWLVRSAEPTLDEPNHLVRIHYRVTAGRDDRMEEKFEEIHTMRYFFPEEVEILLEWAGFADIRLYPFLNTQREITAEDWNLTVVANRPPLEDQGAQHDR